MRWTQKEQLIINKTGSTNFGGFHSLIYDHITHASVDFFHHFVDELLKEKSDGKKKKVQNFIKFYIYIFNLYEKIDTDIS